MRSIFGRARVTRRCGPARCAGGIFSAGTNGSLAAFQASKPPSSVSADTSSCRSQAAVPWASLAPRRHETMAVRPENSSPQSAASSWLRLTVPGISRGSAAKSASVRTSISTGMFAVPINRASLSGDIVV